MVKKFQDATYGEIVCEEGFLGNVKSIIVNGVPATKVNKTSFVFVHEDEEEDPKELKKLADNRAREHAQNLIKMMFHPKLMSVSH